MNLCKGKVPKSVKNKLLSLKNISITKTVKTKKLFVFYTKTYATILLLTVTF